MNARKVVEKLLKAPVRKVTVDASKAQTADDGDTTRYGGVTKVGNTKVRLYGNDRDGGAETEVAEAVAKELGISVDAVFDASYDDDDVSSALDGCHDGEFILADGVLSWKDWDAK